MSSLEDDGFGDELAVIWELESGTQVIPHQELPRPGAGRLDPPERLEAFLDAVRWGAVATADSRALQAPFRSGITIEDYQLDPVVRALSMPRANLLIADDVGLGKTIEAGLVVQELLLRHRARTVVVVCPAGLCVKWQEEMRDRFGLEFRIVNTDAVRQLRRDRGVGANVFTSFPRLIVSIDWLKDRRAQSLLDEVLSGVDHRRTPRTFDLLIVDEVHSAAPSGRGRYAVDSLRTRAIQRLAPHCEHRLFLSATPHNGYRESFTALLELLDPQRFARGVDPNPEQLARVLVRRLKRELREELPPNPDGTPRFPVRRVEAMEVDYPADEREAHALLERYAALRRSRHDTGSKRSAADFVTLLLKKRLLSSPVAFANTLAQHRTTLDRHDSTRQPPTSEAQMQPAWHPSSAAPAEHGVAHLVGQHGADRAEVVTDLLDLVRHLREEPELGGERGRVVLPSLGDEVADLDEGVRLAVAVDTAVALLQPGRVPRDLPVEHPPAVQLEVDALRGGVGGHQDPHRRPGWTGLELGLRALTVVGVHAPVEGGDPLAPVAAEPVGEEEVDQPLLGVPVLSEDDDPLVVPPASRGPAGGLEPLEEHVGPRVAAVAARLDPAAEAVEDVLLLGRERLLPP